MGKGTLGGGLLPMASEAQLTGGTILVFLTTCIASRRSFSFLTHTAEGVFV